VVGTPAVHVALLLVQLAFAANAIIGKMAVSRAGVDPSALAFCRAAGGALAFQVARVLTTRSRSTSITRADHLRFFAYAVLGVLVNQAFFLHGLKRSTATSTGLLAAAIPVFTAAIAAMTGQEKTTARTAFAMGLATIGVLTLTGVQDVSIGNLLVTINSLSYAGYLVGVRPLLQKHGAITTIAWVFTYGALMLAFVGLVPTIHDAPSWSPLAVELVGFCILVPTIFAYLANAWALERARPSIVAAYIYLQPLLVTLSAAIYLGERLTLRLAAAGVAILAGVTIIATRGNRVAAKKIEAPTAP
jgi:drug/metabolite transporter (DMT)-like permease